MTKLYKTGREVKFLDALSKRNISRKQAIAWFNLRNPSAAVLRFQEAGVDVKRTYKQKSKSQYKLVTYSL